LPDQVFNLGVVQVPEGRQLFDQMTVEENVLMGAYCRTGRAKIAGDLEHVYSLFPKLKERRRQLAGSLSGDHQKFRCGLAPVVVDLLLDTLTEIRKKEVTVLLVEHDIFSAFHVADRGYVLETGKIVRVGSAAELANDPEVRRAYLGI
jgi:branched-chain amino acid transport system ATP-binding protein